MFHGAYHRHGDDFRGGEYRHAVPADRGILMEDRGHMAAIVDGQVIAPVSIARSCATRSTNGRNGSIRSSTRLKAFDLEA